MSRIQFERRKKKSMFLLPLVVLLLLYIAIPTILINKGSKLLNKAQSKIEQADVYAPTVEFYNGMTFLQTASSFPGFSFWADNVIESSVKKLASLQEPKFKALITSNVDKAGKDIKDVYIHTNETNSKRFLHIDTKAGAKIELELSDSLLTTIDSSYCKEWTKFFDKTGADKSQLNSICKQ